MVDARRTHKLMTENNRSTNAVFLQTLPAGIDWFLPSHVRGGDFDLLRRARLVVAFCLTLIAVAIIFVGIYLVVPSTIIVAALLTGIGVGIACLSVMKCTGSCFVSGNLLTATFFGVLTIIAYRLGGLCALILPWYAGVPVAALSTAGRRSATSWLAVTASALFAFYMLDYSRYSFPQDVGQQYFNMLSLISWGSLILLMLGLALLQETAKNQTLAELKQSETDLAKARDAAEAASCAKSEFLANMSHEIRTPMTAILGFTDLLNLSLTDPDQIEAAATIKRNGYYLLKIINDILDLSKIEAGKMEVEHVKCSPCQILSDVVFLMRVRADAKNLPLEIEYDGAIPQTIQSDPTQLRQILINLTGNAVKFTEVGKVRLVARLLNGNSPQAKMQFEVIDTGIGMTDEQIGRLFKPFHQADTSTTRNFGGTGLGLMISKRLARKLGGDIAVKSVIGQGSTFTVTVETGSLDNEKLLDNPGITHLPTETDGQLPAVHTTLDCRVLLAEDGPDNQRLITFILKKAGATVDVASNGKIACDLALAKRNEGTPFDVILMDMQMPVMDGYDATNKLRQAGYTYPIIALTAHAMSTDREICLTAGCDEYLAKPIDREKLISLIAEYASQNNFASPTTSRIPINT